MKRLVNAVAASILCLLFCSCGSKDCKQYTYYYAALANQRSDSAIIQFESLTANPHDQFQTITLAPNETKYVFMRIGSETSKQNELEKCSDETKVAPEALDFSYATRVIYLICDNNHLYEVKPDSGYCVHGQEDF